MAHPIADSRRIRMDYVRLGKTGLEVSRLCLGCMTYGTPERGTHPWTLDEAATRPLIKQAWINLRCRSRGKCRVYSAG